MSEEKNEPYRVLARKYRPQNFDELIGQEALVRTLSNAIESGRIAHAFMLTGVRGVGKTTTARIIAKALNYKGPDGTSGPTVGPTDDCSLCQAISEDRHPDVIEMDAATRTGVDDIREILDGVRYAPTEARYKVYVIDEVHMLSKNAFNALLKTLEEPPEHVKFIFATTEIRKVPITVLSRCQRFDLRRVDVPTLSAHFTSICEKEGVNSEEAAMAMIARAADGSVRDGLSLLDRGIALCDGDAGITAAQVEDMLGLADRARNLDLLEKALVGDMPGALDIMDGLYRSGADPIVMMQDLLTLTHVLTKCRAVPETQSTGQVLAEGEMVRAGEMAAKLSMPSLAKAWQILLKGLAEVQAAPNPQAAAEMVIIRLVYAANLPDPADLVKRLKDAGVNGGGATAPTPSAGGGAAAHGGTSMSSAPSAPPAPPMPQSMPEGAPVARSRMDAPQGGAPALAIVPEAPAPVVYIQTLQDVVAVLEQGNSMLLASNVVQYVHLVKIENKGDSGRLEINLDEMAPPKLAQDLGQTLSRLNEQRWVVSVVSAQGAATLAQVDRAEAEAERNNILQMPIMKTVFEAFPDAEFTTIKREPVHVPPPVIDEEEG